MSRILLVQLADLGDLIVTTPAISALREALPDAHLALLTSAQAAPVVSDTNLVDEIITLDREGFNSTKAFFQPGNLRRILSLRHGHYDTVIFFHHFTLKPGTIKFALIALASGAKRRLGLQNGNGWFLNESIPDVGFGAKHQAQYWLDLVGLLGAESTSRPLTVTIRASTLVPSVKPTVVIHPGSGGFSLARRWDAEKFAAVADMLHEQHGAQIVLVGRAGDGADLMKPHMRHVPLDLTDKTSLSELAGVIQQADLYIGTDSGVTHLASATGTPILAIFGPSNHEAWHPWTPDSRSIVVRSAPECSPCSYIGHGVGLRDGCAARTCMRMVTAQQVLSAAQTLLNETDYVVEAQHVLPLPGDNSASSSRIRVLGLPVDAITYDQWLDFIGQWIEDGSQVHHVCTINPEFIMIAQNDPNFRNILNRADLCIPDGIGLLWAAKRLGKPLPQRVTGSDGVPIIAERAAREGWKLFFLGAAPGIAEKAADVLRTKHPDLQITGTYAGSPAGQEEDEIVAKINAAGADILFVAYGAPSQDKWIARNLPRLKVRMAMGVGGAFDFIAGVVPRAPVWMQRAGLEWLYRLYLQPWRIKRMLRLPRFVIAVLLRGEK